MKLVGYSSLLLGVFLFSGILSGQELAKMPYRHLIKIARGELDDDGVKSYQMSISSNIGVAPEKIELLLDTKGTPTHLIVDDKGFFNVPNNVGLYSENPMMVANQPRGTLMISFQLSIPPFDPPKIENGVIKYKKLFAPVIKMQNQVRKVDSTFGLLGKDRFALVIKTDKPIKIVRESGVGEKAIKGSRIYRPKKGVIYMIMEAYMFEDDPIVEIPGKVKIELQPVSAKDAERLKAAY